MRKGLHFLFVCMAICSLTAFCMACGETEVKDGGEETAAPEASAKTPGDINHEVAEDPDTQPQAVTNTLSVKDALKAMAASKGIYFGEVPERFPLDLLPLYPGGTIEQSAIDDDGATLLQVVPASKETVLNHYRDYYKKLGMSVDTEPMTVMGRTMVGFSGSAVKISMTMSDREEGKTFVSLAF